MEDEHIPVDNTSVDVSSTEENVSRETTEEHIEQMKEDVVTIETEIKNNDGEANTIVVHTLEDLHARIQQLESRTIGTTNQSDESTITTEEKEPEKEPTPTKWWFRRIGRNR